VEEIDFLGVIVGKGGIQMDPIKTRAIADWVALTNLKQLRSFIQFVNFYRVFFEHFATVMEPLNRLLKKNEPWRWEQEQQDTFDACKKIIANDATLLLPVDNTRFRLETDASDYAAGAVLHQIIDGRP
jgi:hypothetical protein